jgi:hypothetical protein
VTLRLENWYAGYNLEDIHLLGLLYLAEHYGWPPAEETSRLTDREAGLLADALERAVPDLPDQETPAPELPALPLRVLEHAPGGWEIIEVDRAGAEKRSAAMRQREYLFAVFAGEDAKQWIREKFVPFCRAGGFTIDSGYRRIQ